MHVRTKGPVSKVPANQPIPHVCLSLQTIKTRKRKRESLYHHSIDLTAPLRPRARQPAAALHPRTRTNTSPPNLRR